MGLQAPQTPVPPVPYHPPNGTISLKMAGPGRLIKKIEREERAEDMVEDIAADSLTAACSCLAVPNRHISIVDLSPFGN